MKREFIESDKTERDHRSCFYKNFSFEQFKSEVYLNLKNLTQTMIKYGKLFPQPKLIFCIFVLW